MRVKSNIKARGITSNNHNQTVKRLRVKSNEKARGLTSANHNQDDKGLRVKSNVKAGKLAGNHTQTLARQYIACLHTFNSSALGVDGCPG